MGPNLQLGTPRKKHVGRKKARPRESIYVFVPFCGFFLSVDGSYKSLIYRILGKSHKKGLIRAAGRDKK